MVCFEEFVPKTTNLANAIEISCNFFLLRRNVEVCNFQVDHKKNCVNHVLYDANNGFNQVTCVSLTTGALNHSLVFNKKIKIKPDKECDER